ncbi:MAG: biotin--[acetyl-CoA-carboxylase] ligase [Candidatus Zixiibacteriota bacterium]
MPETKEHLADRLLAKIRTRPNHSFKIEVMAKSFKTEIASIIEALSLLADWGYKIKSDAKSITFIEPPDLYLSDEVRYKLKTKLIAKEVLAYQSVQSTNTIAQVLAASGAKDGTLIVSEYQKKGRGRLGRKWYSSANLGLYCSIILKPKINPSVAPGISLIAALAMVETIKSYTEEDVRIKWPNDVLINGRKVCGILTEMLGEFNRTHFVVVGVGVNINHRRQDIPDEIKKTASSIRLASGRKIKRVKFLQEFLVKFENEYILFKNNGLDKSRKRIIKYSTLIGHRINLKIGSKTISGNVLDIDDKGQLVVETGGKRAVFSAGEVTLS